MRTQIRPTVAVVFAAALTLLLLGLVPSAGAGGGKQQICHRTGSSSNPYVGIQPSNNAQGHNTHPEQNGNNDKRGKGWTSGPHQSNSACTKKTNPPEVCTPPDAGCPEPAIPPRIIRRTITTTIAEPAAPVAGQPTVTG